MSDTDFVLRTVRDWRAKQTPAEKRRWDQIFDYFRAGHRLPGSVLPNGKIIIQSGSHPTSGVRMKVDPKTGRVTAAEKSESKTS
jgi:hypothetical protein